MTTSTILAMAYRCSVIQPPCDSLVSSPVVCPTALSPLPPWPLVVPQAHQALPPSVAPHKLLFGPGTLLSFRHLPPTLPGGSLRGCHPRTALPPAPRRLSIMSTVPSSPDKHLVHSQRVTQLVEWTPHGNERQWLKMELCH